MNAMTDRQGRTYEVVGSFRYRIASTNRGSSSLGNCEVCDKPCDVVHLQVQERYVVPEPHEELPDLAHLVDDGGGFWTRHECTDHFGHPNCLRTVRV